MLSEKKPDTEKQIMHYLTYIWNLNKLNSQKENRMVVSRGWEWEKWGEVGQQVQEFKFQDMFQTMNN